MEYYILHMYSHKKMVTSSLVVYQLEMYATVHVHVWVYIRVNVTSEVAIPAKPLMFGGLSFL